VLDRGNWNKNRSVDKTALRVRILTCQPFHEYFLQGKKRQFNAVKKSLTDDKYSKSLCMRLPSASPKVHYSYTAIST